MSEGSHNIPSLYIDILTLVPSAWDLGTDYSFAETLEEDSIRSLSYMFISLPGFLIKKALDRFCFNHKASSTGYSKILDDCIGLIVWSLVLTGIFAVMFNCVWTTPATAATTAMVMKVIATMVGTTLLGIKVLGVLVHSENMKMINIKATHYEGVYESAFQLALVFYVKLTDRTKDWDYDTMLSSLVMIGKSGAENFLTSREENKLAEKNILSKLKMVAKFSLPFLLTSLFRMLTLSMCFACNKLTFFLILPVALILPTWSWPC